MMNQIDFNGVVSGDFDTESLTYKSIRLEIGRISPSKLQILVELVKQFCDCPPTEFDPTMINDAVKAVEKAEFPKEKIQEIKRRQRIMARKALEEEKPEPKVQEPPKKIEKPTIKEQLKKRGRPKKVITPVITESKKPGRPRGNSKHAQLQDRIIEVLGESGPKDMVELREAILPKAKAADPAYQNFYAALNNLKYRGTVEKADNGKVQLAVEENA